MRRRRYPPSRWLVWMLAVGLAGVPSPWLWAQNSTAGSDRGMAAASNLNGASFLAKGIALYDEMEWDAAVEQLNRALREDLSAQEKAQAYWYLAVIAQAQDASEEALKYLVELLRYQPDFQLPETLRGTDFEPLFKTAFAQTDRTPPLIHILAPPESRAGEPLRVVAQISDDSNIARVELAYSGEQGVSRSLPMVSAGNGQWTAEIPSEAIKGPGAMELRVTATDAWRNTAIESTTTTIAKRGGGHTLLYIVGGVLVAAGGGVAAALFGGSGDEGTEPPQNGTPDQDKWPQSRPPLPPQ